MESSKQGHGYDVGVWFFVLWSLTSFLFFTFLLKGVFNQLYPDLSLFILSLLLAMFFPRIHAVWMALWIFILPQFDLHLFAWNSNLDIRSLWPKSPIISFTVGTLLGLTITRYLWRKEKFLYTFYEKLILGFSTWLFVGVFVAMVANLKGFQGWTFDFTSLLLNIWHFSSEKPYHVLQPWFFSSFLISAPLLLILRPRIHDAFTKKVLMYTSLVSVGYVLIQQLIPMGYTRYDNFKPHGFFEDIHAYASLLIASILYLMHFGHWRNPKKIALCSLALMVLTFLLIKTGSRNSYLGLTLFTIPYFVWLFWKKLPWHLSQIKWVSVLLAIGCLYFLSATIPHTQTLITELGRVESLEDLDRKVLSYRGSLMGSALKVFMRHPLTGYGTNNFVMAQIHPEYRTGPFFQIVRYENAHCYFIQILADNGIIGFLLWIVVFLFPVIKKMKNHPSPLTFFLTGLLLTNILAHSLLIFGFWLLYVLILPLDLSTLKPYSSSRDHGGGNAKSLR